METVCTKDGKISNTQRHVKWLPIERSTKAIAVALDEEGHRYHGHDEGRDLAPVLSEIEMSRSGTTMATRPCSSRSTCGKRPSRSDAWGPLSPMATRRLERRGTVQAIHHIARLRRDQPRLQMGVPHGRLDVGVPQHFPHFVDAQTVLNQSRRVRMP